MPYNKKKIDTSALAIREKELDKLANKLENALKKYPKGHIRISKSGNSTQYYHVLQEGRSSSGKRSPQDSHGKNGRYLRKDERPFAQKLLQKEYYQKVIKEARRESKAIHSFLRSMKGIPVEDIFPSLDISKQSLVSPVALSDEEYAKNWESVKYEKCSYPMKGGGYDTQKGDIVRSKAEAMIADALFELGIPYRYEYPLVLSNGETKYPDFTLLKLPEREVIYLEFFGLFDDPDYLKKNLKKIKDYNSSDIYLGKNFIFVFETEEYKLSIVEVKQMLCSVFDIPAKYD